MKSKLFGNTTKIILLITFAILPLAFAQAQNTRKANKKTVKVTPTPTPKIVEPVPNTYSEPSPKPPPPPKPSPVPKPKLTQTPPETFVGDEIKQIQFRNLLLNLPSKMFSRLPYYEVKPEHFKESFDFEIKTNGIAVWTDDIEFYEVLNPRKESLLKVEVVTSLYNTDFTKAAIDGKPAGAAAEKLLELDYLEATKAEEQPDSPVKTVKYFIPNELKPGMGMSGSNSVELEFNLKGVYQMRDDAADKNRFVLTWHTYRSIDGKAGKLKIIISGRKTEMPVAEKILNSTYFEKSSKMVPASEIFKTESINKFGIGSISVPSNMIAEPVKEKTTKNGDVEWMTYDYIWKTPMSKDSNSASLEAKVTTKIYNVDLTKIADDIPIERRTPEFLILMDQVGNSNANKMFGDNRMKESKIMNLDGIDGSYVLFRLGSNSKTFVAAWRTYRLLDGKAQIISITIEGDLSEILKAEQIIKSFKLSAK